MQGMDFARKLRSDRGKGNIIAIDDGEENQEQIGDDTFEVGSPKHDWSLPKKKLKYTSK